MSAYYSLIVASDFSANEVRRTDLDTIEYLFGIKDLAPTTWPSDPCFQSEHGRQPFSTWTRAHVVALTAGIERRISGYDLSFFSQAIDLPEAARYFEALGWFARFVEMDGPIGLFFSPDMMDVPPTVLSVHSRRLCHTKASSERVFFGEAPPRGAANPA